MKSAGRVKSLSAILDDAWYSFIFSEGRVLLEDSLLKPGTGVSNGGMSVFTIDVVVRVHGDQTKFAVPFLPLCLGVDDQVFDAITPHTPVSKVKVSDPVTTLLNRRFGTRC